MAGFRPNGKPRSAGFYLLPERGGPCPACGLENLLELVARNLRGLGWECQRCHYVQPGCRVCNKPIRTLKQARQHNQRWSPTCGGHCAKIWRERDEPFREKRRYVRRKVTP